MEAAFRTLTQIVNDRFAECLRRLPGPTPPHRVVFSKRITTSWALIYYRKRLVRLSPYLFLLDEEDLHHGSHWKELDATLRHEAVHAYLYEHARETGHPAVFSSLLAHLGVEPHGGCDTGPENIAFRYRYACGLCGGQWRRRVPLRGNYSCGHCFPGRFEPRGLLQLVSRESPWERLRQRLPLVRATVDEAAARTRLTVPPTLPDSVLQHVSNRVVGDLPAAAAKR